MKIIWLIGIISVLVGCTQHLNNKRSDHLDLVEANGTVEFDKRIWKEPDPAQRRKMLASLFDRHTFVDKKNDYVYTLFGTSTSYYGYDEDPSYSIDLSGEQFQLQFGHNHSDSPGSIVHVVLEKM